MKSFRMKQSIASEEGFDVVLVGYVPSFFHCAIGHGFCCNRRREGQWIEWVDTLACISKELMHRAIYFVATGRPFKTLESMESELNCSPQVRARRLLGTGNGIDLEPVMTDNSDGHPKLKKTDQHLNTG